MTPCTTEESSAWPRSSRWSSIDDLDDAVPLAAALVRGGLPAIEVTLRTPPALAAIERIAAEVEGAFVGAGTVTTPQQVDDALAAGARFLVSPARRRTCSTRLQAGGVPFLPGTATPSDMLALLERGITHAKFFPAEVVGGVKALKAFAGPFPQMRFCPTGGIDARQGAGLPGAAERGVRRRLVDDQGRRRARRGAGPRGRGARGVSVKQPALVEGGEQLVDVRAPGGRSSTA